MTISTPSGSQARTVMPHVRLNATPVCQWSRNHSRRRACSSGLNDDVGPSATPISSRLRRPDMQGHDQYTKLDDSPAGRPIPKVPALESVGVDRIARDAKGATCEMRSPATLLDQEHVTATGALAVLADGVLGFSITFGIPQVMGMVTTHLHLELLRALPDGELVLSATGRRTGVEGMFAIGVADIAGPDGAPLAQATIGALFLERLPPNEHRAPAPSPSHAPRVIARPARAHRLIRNVPVHELLGTHVHSAGRRGVRMTVEARAAFANSMGGVHGGMGVLMGERALDLAL